MRPASIPRSKVSQIANGGVSGGCQAEVVGIAVSPAYRVSPSTNDRVISWANMAVRRSGEPVAVGAGLRLG